MWELGFDVTHLYGLTETFGPVMICDWRPEWDALDPAEPGFRSCHPVKVPGYGV